MAKKHALVTGRRPVEDGFGSLLLALVALMLWSGCSTGRTSASFHPTSGPLQPASSLATAEGAAGFPVRKADAPPVVKEASGAEEAAWCGPERGPVSDMGTWERLCRATVRAASRLPDSTTRQLLAMVTPRHLPTLGIWSSLWLGPRGKPVVEDVVARAWPTLRANPAPGQARRVSHALWSYVNAATFARTQEELSQAASALEEAVEAADVEAVVFLLDEGLLSSRARLRDTPPGTQLATSVVPASATTERHQDTPPPGGCGTPPPGWPDLSSSGTDKLLGVDSEQLLAPFFACTSPAAFVQLQRGVDMARLVARLDDWSAVRLGALGPVLPEASEVLNRKRASFLVTTTQEYGVALAEVFALFLLDSAFDKDLEQVLRQLARDKRLGQTLGRMPLAREHLRRRGLHLSDYPDRPERPSEDVPRGAREGAGEVVSSIPLFQLGGSLGYGERKRQLPPPYQHALQEVESALVEQALEPGNVLLGVLDELTFGVPLGFYHLAAGVGHGAYSLTQGQYEQATRELTPAALMVALYAGGKGVRYLSRGAPGPSTGGARALQGLEVRLEELKATVERLQGQLGSEGLQELARYLRADPEAALLVAEGGEAGAAALYEARGNVPKAQAWLSQAKSDRPGSTRTRGGAGKSPGGVASLADEAAGLPREVLDARLLEVELDVPGPRLSGDVAVLEKQLVALEKTPPVEAVGHPLWSEYLEYGKGRVADLKRGMKAKHGRELEPPLKWEGYQQMRGLLLRGLAFERLMVELLRADAKLPRAQRRFLQDFDEPRIETYVGVRKPRSGLRFADVLVIERKPLPGQPPRVETFSFKSRDFSQVKLKILEAQMKADARQALEYYGETLEIRRPGLESHVKVQRVHLIYEGGQLKPSKSNMTKAIHEAQQKFPGVEVLFQ